MTPLWVACTQDISIRVWYRYNVHARIVLVCTLDIFLKSKSIRSEREGAVAGFLRCSFVP